MSLGIDSRFRGPTTCGNGGYVSGRIAALHDASVPVTVTLRVPPPLDRSLQVSHDGDVLRVTDGEDAVAEAAPAKEEDATASAARVEPVDVAHARNLAADFPGHTNHPFPECFVCGPSRSDGMRLFPGRLDDGRTACVWDVTADVAESTEFVWAALDCPGGWTAPIEGRPMVLGRMTATVADDQLPATGDTCVVMGRYVGAEGRKVWTETTVYAPDSSVIGSAYATWIVLPT